MNSWKQFRGEVKFREPLKKHVTFRIGGPARVFCAPRDPGELKVLITCAKEATIPLLILGAGSNLLVSDKGVKAAVCTLRTPGFSKMRLEGLTLDAGAGCLLSRAVALCAGKGLTGMEFLAGIPGTVGGAVMMNAGAWGRSIGDILSRVTVMDARGRVSDIPGKKVCRKYRESGLEGKIILSARLRLRKGTRASVSAQIREYAQKRRASQDVRRPSAGCVFKNPAQGSAGKLIDLCGLKGVSRGGALISPLHANFIVNTGNARAADVRTLMALASKEVFKRFHVRLQPEIREWK